MLTGRREDVSIVRCLDEWTSREPDRALYVFLDSRGRQAQAYTYGNFTERTRFLAHHLREAGISVGERVLLAYPPGLESMAAFVACARSGVIPVPVHPPSHRDIRTGMGRMRFVARDCEAVAVLTSSALAGELGVDGVGDQTVSANGRGETALRWIGTDDLSGSVPTEYVDTPGEVLFLQYTSGSTSTPKGVIVRHQNVVDNGIATLGREAVGKVGVSWLPQYHDMGLIGYYLYPLVVGGTTFGFSPLDFLRRPALWLQTISRTRAAFSSSPNFGFEYCLREDKLPDPELEGLDLGSLEWLMNAAEPVRAETFERFFQRFARYGLRRSAHVAAYGLAENTLAVTHHGRRAVAVDRDGSPSQDRRTAGSEARSSVMSCGRPLEGVDVRIVDPTTKLALGSRQVGEIWVGGSSKCQGYWGRPEATAETFENRVEGVPAEAGTYLRTGDLGFLDQGELFVCGRLKDLIIVRGINYYPHDIERVVEEASPQIRTGGVVAFAGDDQEESIVVVAEVKDPETLPDPMEVVQALRAQQFVGPYTVVLVRSKSVDRTTSGKLARSRTRRRWLEGELPCLVTHRSRLLDVAPSPSTGLVARLTEMLEPYGISGREHLTLEEIGIDSLDLVMVVEEIERFLGRQGRKTPYGEIDGRLLQRLTVDQLRSLVELVEGAREDDSVLRPILSRLKEEQEDFEREAMQADAALGFTDILQEGLPAGPADQILLTGPTGFLGPFLLAGLLQRTPFTLHALTRAASPEAGLNRLREGFHQARVAWPKMDRDLSERVRVICGDISQPRLGLDRQAWEGLASEVGAVVHNAALVNYSLNYGALKPHNVDGTRELLRLACTDAVKRFHFISSTIIFGWTPKPRLFEADNNDEMSNLDFGYAQTKWVAERLVLEAAQRGLPVEIYRPSFVSASTGGIASPADITVRLLAFMINHGIGVNARNQISFLPADIAADNIASIIGRLRSADPAPDRESARVFHVTVDDFYSIIDLTRTISREHGFPFVYYDIPEFVAELKRRCEPEDPLYPLLDFVTRSYLKIERMERKRYDNREYRAAREAVGGRPDATLSQTVTYLMRYLSDSGLLRHPLPERVTTLEAAVV